MSTKFNAAFWKWFGDSKVVDSKGSPLVVYHGTAEKFTKFSKKKCGQYTKNKYACSAFFFADKAIEASGFALAQSAHPDDRPNVMPVYLSIQKAVLVDAKGGSWAFMSEFDPKYWGTQEDAFDLAIKNGCDGIVFKNIHDHGNGGRRARKPYTVYVAFSPTQIKSATGNDGTWDVDDPDIRSNPAKVPWEDERLITLIAVSELGGDARTIFGLDLIGWPRTPHRDGTWDDPIAAFENTGATEIESASERYGLPFKEVWGMFERMYPSQIEQEKLRFKPKNEDIRRAEKWLLRATPK